MFPSIIHSARWYSSCSPNVAFVEELDYNLTLASGRMNNLRPIPDPYINDFMLTVVMSEMTVINVRQH